MRSVLGRSVAAAAIGSLLFAASASAAAITVDTTNDTSTVSTCALRDAITAANTNTTPSGSNCTAGDDVNDAITTTQTGMIQLASALPAIDHDMSITGPGAGSLEVRGQGTYRVFVITTPSSGPFPIVTLNGMKVTNGAGGILDNTGGSLALNDVTVSGNTVTSTSATQSAASGAGIENTAGAPVTITSSTVSGNTATATTTGPGLPVDSVFAIASGAGIHMGQGGLLTIDMSTISGNQANANGNQTADTYGAIFNEGPTTIDSGTISGNTATATVSEAGGAGIANANGGGIAQLGGNVNLSLTRDTISGNTAATVTSTASGTGFAVGGGILLNQTFADPLNGSVTGSTIAANTVSGTGPGTDSVNGANVELDTNTGTTFTSKSTIFANGTGAANCFQGRDGTFASQGYNIETSGNSCLGTPTTGDQTSVSSANLALGPLQNNGGPTSTMAPGLTSLAVDKGTRVGIGGVADQRGRPRTFDMNPTSGPPPDGDGTDVGAIEQSVKATPTNNNFGSLQWGTTSGTQLFLMNNYTGNALPAGKVVGGANAGDFQTTSDGCTNASIPNNNFCTMDVAFHPVSPGNGVKNAIVSFSVSPVELATLTGTATGFTPAAIDLAPTTHDFGSTQAGTPTGATQFVVTNTGLGTTGALTASLTGTNASEFGITQNNCTGQLHGSGGTCSVFVRLSPSSAGGKTASLNVTGTPGGTQSSTLTGTATPTGQRAAALKKCKKKKDKQKRKKCKKKANRLPV